MNFILLNWKVGWYDEETQKLKFETELIRQFLVNKVILDVKDRITLLNRLKCYSLHYQDNEYNEKFCDNYDVIK
ncbi:MAG: hypothetical protein ACKO1F_08560 [Flammeovirgaceae bacterium]